MTETLYKKTFPSTLESLAAVMPEALEALAEAGWLPPEYRHCLHLCLEEGLVNAVKHGNGGDETRTVGIAIQAEGDTVTICIHDEGSGFDLSRVPDPEPTQMGGRGICLMKHYMDDVGYDQEARCLRMTLSRRAAQRECGSNEH